MIEIVKHDQVRFFKLHQAQELLPFVYRVTEESAREVRYLMACIEALPDKKSNRAFVTKHRERCLVIAVNGFSNFTRIRYWTKDYTRSEFWISPKNLTLERPTPKFFAGNDVAPFEAAATSTNPHANLSY